MSLPLVAGTATSFSSDPGPHDAYSILFQKMIRPSNGALAFKTEPLSTRATLHELTDILEAVNPFIGLYKTAYERQRGLESHRTLAELLISPELRLSSPGIYRHPRRLMLMYGVPDLDASYEVACFVISR
jgi:hypothetical protein